MASQNAIWVGVSAVKSSTAITGLSGERAKAGIMAWVKSRILMRLTWLLTSFQSTCAPGKP
jgi:hypothetical protein